MDKYIVIFHLLNYGLSLFFAMGAWLPVLEGDMSVKTYNCLAIYFVGYWIVSWIFDFGVFAQF